MRLTHLCTAAVAVLTFMGATASADLAFTTTAPSAFVYGQGDIGGAPQGTANSQSAFGYLSNDGTAQAGTRGRGQSFNFSAAMSSSYAIDNIWVSLNNGQGNATRPDGQLIVSIFEWQGADADDFTAWDPGTGGVFSSGHTQLFSESFAVPAGTQLTNNQWLELTFNPGELSLNGGTDYGIFFRYVLDDPDFDTANTSIAFDTRQDAGVPGALLNTGNANTFAAAGNGQSAGRDFNLFINGEKEIVPEPTSVALLALGAFGLVSRRRRS